VTTKCGSMAGKAMGGVLRKLLASAFISITSENSVGQRQEQGALVTADIVVPSTGSEGVISAQRSHVGSWSLYAKGGKLKYCYDLLGIQQFYVRIKRRAASGRRPATPGISLTLAVASARREEQKRRRRQGCR
jgi:hypothetical protein